MGTRIFINAGNLILGLKNPCPERQLINPRLLVIATTTYGFRQCSLESDQKFRNLLSHVDASAGSVTHKSHIFIDSYTLPAYELTSSDARRSLSIENHGGGSEISEFYSIDYFQRIYAACNFVFEEEIEYWIDYSMVDYICDVNGTRIGVSVSRAMGYPDPTCFTHEKAAHLLRKKLYGLIVARNSVIKSQSFLKSVLHIWCQTLEIAELLRHEFAQLDDNDYGLDIKGIVLLQLTVCNDTQIYRNILL